MREYESFFFNRTFRNENIEFFLIGGVNNQENFTDYWDGRETKLLGYLTIFTDVELDKELEQLNLIHLIEGVSQDNERIIKHTKKIISHMTISNKYLDIENVKVYNTQVHANGTSAPYNDLIKSIIQNDVPYNFVEKLKFPRKLNE
ncbi:hypothetical protein QTL97_11440 [Sporosarcina thermotolerans]|uniref:Uncharacterized protein n=1 Tax=Sporosarcina thermotolerans TaxID=633404 RepID=A0AAW9A7Z8_9BACL|nr:hypothetical protein [Sporosarcina thermotolerans]MDW0117552.1 hypothetical protein [Sporosarcina thermotolerans]